MNEKMTFKQYIENLWYHEKAKIIIFGVLIIAIIVCATQCAQRKEPDVYLVYAGSRNIERTVVNDISNKMPDFIPEDYNGDGVKSASFEQFQFTADSNGEKMKQFETLLSDGKNIILFMSPDNYKYYRNKGYLMKLEEVVGKKPSFADDEYSINFFKLECCTEMGAILLPEDTVVCIAKPKKKDSEYNKQIQFFKYMLSYDM